MEYDHDTIHGKQQGYGSSQTIAYYADGEVWSSKEKFLQCKILKL